MEGRKGFRNTYFLFLGFSEYTKEVKNEYIVPTNVV